MPDISRAIQWLTSYSEYLTDLAPWYTENVDKRFIDYRNQLVYILTQENGLMEIVKLIGSDVLPDDQKLVLEIAKVTPPGLPPAECLSCRGHLCSDEKAV